MLCVCLLDQVEHNMDVVVMVMLAVFSAIRKVLVMVMLTVVSAIRKGVGKGK